MFLTHDQFSRPWRGYRCNMAPSRSSSRKSTQRPRGRKSITNTSAARRKHLAIFSNKSQIVELRTLSSRLSHRHDEHNKAEECAGNNHDERYKHCGFKNTRLRGGADSSSSIIPSSPFQSAIFSSSPLGSKSGPETTNTSWTSHSSFSSNAPVRFDLGPFRLAPQADDMLGKMIAANPEEEERLRREFEGVRAVGLWLAMKEVISWRNLEDMLLHWGHNEVDAKGIEKKEKHRLAMLNLGTKPRKRRLHEQMEPFMFASEHAKIMGEILDELAKFEVFTEEESDLLKDMMYGKTAWLNLRSTEVGIHPVTSKTTDRFGSIPARKGGKKVVKTEILGVPPPVTGPSTVPSITLTAPMATNISANIDDADGDQFEFLGSFVIPSGWHKATIDKRV